MIGVTLPHLYEPLGRVGLCELSSPRRGPAAHIRRRCYWKKRSPREKCERALREEYAAERRCEGADAILTALLGCIPRGSDHGAPHPPRDSGTYLSRGRHHK